MSNRLLLPLFCLAFLAFLPWPSLASDPWDPPGGCRLESWSDVAAWRDWNKHTPAADDGAWAEERQRFADNPEVWRWYDRLYIAIERDRVLTLADCPFGDSMHRYSYERYDEPGGFHVVHVWRYEDHFYALVMRSTGTTYSIPGLPVWSPDRTRFAYAVCVPPDGTTDEAIAEVAVMHTVDHQPQLETNVAMPCFLDDCKLVWEDDRTVGVTCEQRDSTDSKRSVMRLTRQGDGWTAMAVKP